jgi:type VI secretion system secreted protein Hcp
MTVDMYLKVDGVTGESADSNHAGWIDITNYHWEAVQSASMASGGGGGTGKVRFNDLRVMANLDKAASALIKFCASGKHIAEVKLSMCKAGGTQIEYSTIVLKDVIVTVADFNGDGGNEVVGVHYAFQAAKVEMHYWTQVKDGSKGPESQFGWDIKANQATA